MSVSEAAILVVDDNADNRYTLCRRLRREGYTDLEEAPNGREALERLETRPFDLVLLDIMMPELDGFQVLERLKAHATWRHIPVIMISALSEFESVVRCIELGAEDYLQKPFNSVLLRARVRASLERKRLHDREAAHLAEIDRQRQRADRLLHAILPGPAVAELKAADRITPRRFEEVAVLFADVLGFTLYCDRHPPEHVVANLDRLAGAFEDITHSHGLEKIKTVGDAFVATANLLEPHDDSVMACLGAASALAEAARCTPAKWQMRSRDSSRPGGGRRRRVHQVQLRSLGRYRERGAEAVRVWCRGGDLSERQRLGSSRGSRPRTGARTGIDQRQGRHRDHPLRAQATVRLMVCAVTRRQGWLPAPPRAI